MTENTESTDATLRTDPDSIIDDLASQTEDLCNIHDHSTRIIANLDINEEWFRDYEDPERARFELVPIVKVFLYMYMGDLGQRELARRLRGAAYIYIRFELDHPPTQQDISYNKRHRFSAGERSALKEAADRLSEICADHDVIDVENPIEPQVEPDNITRHTLPESLIRDAVKRATKLGFEEFSAGRASNARFDLEVYFERQSYLNLSQLGTTSPKRRFKRLSERSTVPSAAAHNKTLHKVAAPEQQLEFGDFTTDGRQKPEWKRVRDELLEPFHAGVSNILDELTSEEYGKQGIREPVTVAIDITTWNFWPYPFVPRHEAEPEDERVSYTDSYGNTHNKVLKSDHPEMVSGVKDDDERAYKFATITTVMGDTPIVLGIEPVRDRRRWEPENLADATSRGEVVERLLEQASQHVDIHKVFLDREFDSAHVRDVSYGEDAMYVLGKRNQSKVDKERIEEIREDEVYDSKLGYGSVTYDGRTHDVTYVYKPTDINGEEYTIFTVPGHVDHHRAEALVGQYAQRMEIEEQYRTIKNNFLPTCASKDYEMRFLFFVIAALLYNVWRLANFTLRDDVAANLGDDPPIQAGEVVELVAFFLFKHG